MLGVNGIECALKPIASGNLCAVMEGVISQGFVHRRPEVPRYCRLFRFWLTCNLHTLNMYQNCVYLCPWYSSAKTVNTITSV
jgi:hypothetical protein